MSRLLDRLSVLTNGVAEAIDGLSLVYDQSQASAFLRVQPPW